MVKKRRSSFTKSIDTSRTAAAEYEGAARSALLPSVITAMAIGAAFLLMLRNLGHAALTYWDESFHALVARNLLRHPLVPTLIERPFLAFDPTSWTANHVWLHKPILPLWQIALSYATFGIGTFSLRLPSAILACSAAALTYLIGSELFDRRTAAVAATVQAFSPAVFMLVHGYLFADHVDVALLFWTELSIYFALRSLRRGTFFDAAMAGAAQGLAFLSKTYPALIVTVIVLCAWLVARPRTKARGFGARQFLTFAGATLVTAGPWMLYTALRFPVEFRNEQIYIFKHFASAIDSWEAPWDRLIFDYAALLFNVFYGFVLVAAAFFVPRLIRLRERSLVVIYAWGAGVLLPHLLASSKTPSATLIGTPAFLLLLALLMTNAVERNPRALAACTGVALACLFAHPSVAPPGQGYAQSRQFAAVMYQNLWVVWCVLGGVIALLAIEIASRFAVAEKWGVVVRRGALTLAAAVVVWLFTLEISDARGVVELNLKEPSFSDVAAYAATTQDNAVFLFDESRRWGDHQLAEFLSGRTSYRYEGEEWRSMAREVRERGGVPYLVTPAELTLQVVYRSTRDGRTVYRIP
ncbi:MAG: glycosyltransferase family 39 protein [Acidobacteriota bacterium]